MLNKCIRRYFFFPLPSSALQKKKKKTPDRRLIRTESLPLRTSIFPLVLFILYLYFVYSESYAFCNFNSDRGTQVY